MAELLFRDDAYLRECGAVVTRVDADSIELDRTVFYPAAGGQAGDSGALVLDDGRALCVRDTRKGERADDVLHRVDQAQLIDARIAPGARVTARLDWARRYHLMRLHTCMHLLCAVVPAPVTGGNITPERAHLDFDIAMEQLVKEAIEARLNALIAAGHAVEPRWVTDAELEARPELVRTMSVKPPSGTGRVRLLDIAGIDLQPCGGTHVRNTAEIGPVSVIRIRNEGKRNKRVAVALAGDTSSGPA